MEINPRPLRGPFQDHESFYRKERVPSWTHYQPTCVSKSNRAQTIQNDADWIYTWIDEPFHSTIYEPIDFVLTENKETILLYNQFSNESLIDFRVVMIDSLGHETFSYTYDGPVRGDDIGHFLILSPSGEILVIAESRREDLSFPYYLIRVGPHPDDFAEVEIPARNEIDGFSYITSAVMADDGTIYYAGFGEKKVWAGSIDNTWHDFQYFEDVLDFEYIVVPEIILNSENEPVIGGYELALYHDLMYNWTFYRVHYYDDGGHHSIQPYHYYLAQLTDSLTKKWHISEFIEFASWEDDYYAYNLPNLAFIIDRDNHVILNVIDFKNGFSYLRKLSGNDGSVIWERSRSIENNSSAFLAAIAVDDSNYIYFQDMERLSRLNQNGDYLWTNDLVDRAKFIALDKDNNVHLYVSVERNLPPDYQYWSLSAVNVYDEAGQIKNNVTAPGMFDEVKLDRDGQYVGMKYEAYPDDQIILTGFSLNSTINFTRSFTSNKNYYWASLRSKISGSDGNLYTAIHSNNYNVKIISIDGNGAFRWKIDFSDRGYVHAEAVWQIGDNRILWHLRFFDSGSKKWKFSLLTTDFQGNIVKEIVLDLDPFNFEQIYSGSQFDPILINNEIYQQGEYYRKSILEHGIRLMVYDFDGNLKRHSKYAYQNSYYQRLADTYIDRNGNLYSVIYFDDWIYKEQEQVPYHHDYKLVKIDAKGQFFEYKLQFRNVDYRFSNTGFLYAFEGNNIYKVDLKGNVIWKIILPTSSKYDITFNPNGRMAFIDSDEDGYRLIQVEPDGSYRLFARQASIQQYEYRHFSLQYPDEEMIVLSQGNGPVLTTEIYQVGQEQPVETFYYTTPNGSSISPNIMAITSKEEIEIVLSGSHSSTFSLLQFSTGNTALLPPPLPADLQLWGNFPNPFNNSTVIQYTVPKAGNLEIKVYNTLGQEVASFKDYVSAGRKSFPFTVNYQSSGMYFYQVNFEEQVKTGKMVLVK